MLKTVFSFFEIDKCGYYETRSPLPKFGNIKEIVDQLTIWINGKSLQNTCTYEVVTGGAEMRTFCLAIETIPKTDTYLITLWNEIPHSKGKVASVSATANTGSVNIRSNQLPPGNIPGYPTYFWILPTNNLYATICQPGDITSNPSFLRYLYEFMAKFTKYVDRDPSDPSKIIGYSENKEDSPIDLRPRFIAGLRKKESTIKYVKKNRVSAQ